MAQDPFNPKPGDKPVYTGTAWGKGFVHDPAHPPKGDASYTNIGSHEKVGPSARKVEIHRAGELGVKPPGGPKGGNAPIAAKPPKGR